MYVTLSDQAKTKEALHFTMRRRTTRLIVEIAGFKSEFPGDAAHNTISLEVGGKTMTAKLSRITYDSGLSYTYRLTVGKEKLETTEVTVADWTGREVIPGGEAKAN